MEGIGLYDFFAHTILLCPTHTSEDTLFSILCCQCGSGSRDQFQVSIACMSEQEPFLSSWHHTQESPESPTEGNVRQKALPFTETDVHEDNQCSYPSEGDEKGAHSPFR